MAIFYTGSYTQEGAPAAFPSGKGIGCFELNQQSGELELLHYTKQRSPSYLVVSNNLKFLYAVEEMFENLNPEIYAYKIGLKGELTLLNKQIIKGDYACHLAIIQDRVLIANYVSGNVRSYPILEDGSLAPSDTEIQHRGAGPDPVRQEAAHAHMVYPFKRDHIYVVDLALDTAKAYQLDPETRQWKTRPALDIKIDAGAGARHMLLDEKEDFAFVLSELTGEIFVADLRSGVSEIIQKVSFIPETNDCAIGGAAIRLHPGGEYLYASNRGSDTLAVFRMDKSSSRLIPVANYSSAGKTPRDFNIDPEGRWLIAANQDSNELVVFAINENDGRLSLRSKFDVETPVNICWL